MAGALSKLLILLPHASPDNISNQAHGLGSPFVSYARLNAILVCQCMARLHIGVLQSGYYSFAASASASPRPSSAAPSFRREHYRVARPMSVTPPAAPAEVPHVGLVPRVFDEGHVFHIENRGSLAAPKVAPLHQIVPFDPCRTRGTLGSRPTPSQSSGGRSGVVKLQCIFCLNLESPVVEDTMSVDRSIS